MHEAFWEYATKTAGTKSPKVIAAHAGVDSSQASRWGGGSRPGATQVIQFARSVHVSPVTALIMACYLEPGDVDNEVIELPVSLHDMSTGDLLDLQNDVQMEIRRRYDDGGSRINKQAPPA